MARPGITYAEVAEAASHLIGQNKNPTIEQIRLFLGTGSSTTIANHLKRWRDAQKSTSLLAAKENIPEELVEMLKGLWERVIEQADVKMGVIEANAERKIADLQQGLQKYKSNNERWQKLFNQWIKEKEVLANDKSERDAIIELLQKDNANLQNKNKNLELQLQEKQERINELHQLHTQSQKNLEHYRESAHEQRLIEQQQFAQQKQELQTEIKIHKEQMIVVKEKTASLQQQHQALKQSYTALENTYKQTVSKLKNCEQQLVETEKAKNEYQQGNVHWQNQYKEMQKNLDIKTIEFITIQAETKVLSRQLTDAKQSLNEAQTHNKLLDHEKWMIVQEKAQLEGQLTQMQKMISA